MIQRLVAPSERRKTLALTIPAATLLLSHAILACPYQGPPCCLSCTDAPPVALCPNQPPACADVTSSAPVRYLDGVLQYRSPALQVQGIVDSMSIRLGFNNRPKNVVNTYFRYGYNWWLQGVPFVERRPDNTLIMIWGATSTAEFAPGASGTWSGSYGVTAGISAVVDAVDSENVLQLDGLFGGKVFFHRWDHSTYWMRGKVKRIVTPGGQETTFTHSYYGIATIVDSNGYQWSFTYSGARLQSIVVMDLTHTAVPLKAMTFAYYSYSENHGLYGDLKSVTIVDYTSGNTAYTKTAYYCYYKDSARAHRLRFILDPESYAQASNNGALNLDQIFDAEDFSEHADYEIDYYTDGGVDQKYRVASEYVRAAGCGCGGDIGASGGAFTYSYEFQSEGSSPYNDWVTRVTQTNPDGTTKIVETSRIGSPINVILAATASGTTKRWATHHEYLQTNGKLLRTYFPSACTVTMNGSDPVVQLGVGLVKRYTYNSTTHGLESVFVQNHGASPTESREVTKYTYESGTFPRIHTVAVLREVDEESSTYATTTYAYDYYDQDSDPDNNAQLRWRTVTGPAVDATENGSTQSYTIEWYHPRTGALLWRKTRTSTGAYDVVAYAAFENEDDLWESWVVEDPTATTWAYLKGKMSLQSEVDDPVTGDTGLDIATVTVRDLRYRVVQRTSPEILTQDDSAQSGEASIAPVAVRYYTVLSNGLRVELGCEHVDSTYHAPVSVRVYDREGRLVSQAVGTPSSDDGDISDDINSSAVDSDSDGDVLDNAFDGTLYDRRSWVYEGGHVAEMHVWSDAEDGSSASHYVTVSEYEDGRLAKRIEPDGTVRYFARGWDFTIASDGYFETMHVGPPARKVLTSRSTYDFTKGTLNAPGIKTTTLFYDAQSSSSTTTTYGYDWRLRRTSIADSASKVVTSLAYDELDRVVESQVFYDDDGDGAYGHADDRMISFSKTAYDAAGRVYQRTQLEGDTEGAKVTGERTARVSKTWYDDAGRSIKESTPSGLFHKTLYGAAGRVEKSYVSYYLRYDVDPPAESAASVSADIVLEQTEYAYDLAGNVKTVTGRKRFHDSDDFGELGSANSTAYTTYTWRNVRGDVEKEEFVGTDTGTTTLVTDYSYHDEATPMRYQEVVDSGSKTTRYKRDGLGRVAAIIRNFDDGDASATEDDVDQRVELKYGNPASADPFRVTERWITDTVVDLDTQARSLTTQKTAYIYGPDRSDPSSIPTGAESEIEDGSLLWKIAYADPSTGAAHFTSSAPDAAADAPYQDSFAYDAQGRLIWQKGPAKDATDRTDATTHRYTYDDLGNVELDEVENHRSDIDATVDQVAFDYSPLGRLVSARTESAGAPPTTLTSIAYTYNSFGQVLTSTQSHVSVTKAVTYAYSDDALSRLEMISYPETSSGAKEVHYRYVAGDGSDEYQRAGERLGRVQRIAFGASGEPETNDIVGYEYLGIGRAVGRNLNVNPSMGGTGAVTVRMDADGSPSQSAGYDGLDDLGRIETLWVKPSSGSAYNQIGYTYHDWDQRPE